MFILRVLILCWFISPLAFAMQNYDVIVIGAGVSGLTAANKLHKAHKKVLILEAKDRLGGRVYTTYDWGFATDLGASWIHGIKDNPLMSLLGNMKFYTNTYSDSKPQSLFRDFALYSSNGKRMPQAGIQEWTELTNDFIHYARQQNKTTTYQDIFNAYAHSKALNHQQKALLYYALINMYTYEFAADLNVLSPNTTSICDDSDNYGKNVILPEGYFKLFAPLSHGVQINLNQVVHQINYGTQGVDVVTQNNTYHAEKVIVTVPLGVLKAGKIAFNPELPKSKRLAIEQMGMGHFEKLYLLFDQVFWDKDKEWLGMLPKDENSGFNIFNYYKYTKKPILIFFTSGQLAQKMEMQQLTDWAMAQLKTMYGNTIPYPIKIKKTFWGSDPYTLGSYSYLPFNVDKKVIQDLAEPVNKQVYFAGEATSPTSISTVHGAYQSGLRVAAEILE